MNSKFLFVALVLSSLLTKLNAQEMKWGVKAGYNLSTIKSDIEDEKYFSGYHLGATFEYKISSKLSVQPELFYSLEGVKLKLNYQIGGNDNFSVELGPQIGYLISAKNDYTLTGANESESGKDNMKSDFNTVNLALKFGLGYELNNKMFFQARYTYGLNDINKSSSDDEGIESKITNQGFQLSVGYRF
jgi:opacity protein-like surface antigen